MTVSCEGSIRFSAITAKELNLAEGTRVVFGKNETDDWLFAIATDPKDSWKITDSHGFHFRNKTLAQAILETYNSRHKKYIKFILKLNEATENGFTYHKLELINNDK